MAKVIIGTCKLCGLSKSLLESHIIPEFLYRPIYDDTHTALQIDRKTPKHKKRQKGIVEYLFCEECEALFSKWEDYFARIWFNKKYSLRPIILNKEGMIEIPGINYDLFKLFHLSIIWRVGVSSQSEFKNVRLGKQEDIIRKHLLSHDPGDPIEYAMFGFALRDPMTGSFQDKLISAPEASRYKGHHIYWALYGGVFWYYWISSHDDGTKAKTNCIDRTGILRLAVQDWDKNKSILDFARDLRRINFVQQQPYLLASSNRTSIYKPSSRIYPQRPPGSRLISIL